MSQTLPPLQSLPNRRSPALTPVLKRVQRYWSGLPAQNGVPLRRDVDPRALGAALPHAFVLENAAPRAARIRVSGGAVNDALGMDLRGLPVSCLFDPNHRDGLPVLFSKTFDKQAQLSMMLGWAASYETDRPIATRQLAGHMILLPLRDDSGRVSRALGALVYRRPPIRGVGRFVMLDHAARRAADARPETTADFPKLVVNNAIPQTRGLIHAEPNLRLVQSHQ
ncbi:PAS domain-containing protein [Cognatishimia sp. SS12]|uniref:PAS domain-containing protein n=1 Tax=Cognatishimia sp. SS12 TaxID=2979465 RepID=UPI00232CCFBF|nr:PAS domain-containing protein [Cognatishimia sp. SS12]MDC0737291.1 PAS domain-containing protein [Cognatishimia sp. SS12]